MFGFPSKMYLVSLLMAVLFVTAPSTAFAQTDKVFGPFRVKSADISIIELQGEIAENSALDFRRALMAAPNAKMVVLNSPGGDVSSGLLIADDIYSKGISTFIASGNGCYSACAYIFLAGKERIAMGDLGVHQINSSDPNLTSAQLAISDIIDMLNRFGTPIEVLTIMFRTPPNDMHVFTPQEIAEYRINRTSADAVNPTQAPAIDTPSALDAPRDTESSPGEMASVPSRDAKSSLSELEVYTRRPNRVAIYTGLDFFGSDIGSVRVGTLAECAESCLASDAGCKAFTFNADNHIVKGPNCFMKSSTAQADGNLVAISGVLLSQTDPDPQPFTLGVIDPKQNVGKDVDLPGSDLSTRPSLTDTSPLGCRLECVQNSSCQAYTYVKKKRECWLKAGAPQAIQAEGMISGVKQMMTYAPIRIIPLTE